jgi:hypothetical protein
MGTYTNQASSYKSNADKVILELEDMQSKFEDALSKMTIPKEGDYLTEHVQAELEEKIEEIKKLIADINTRSGRLNEEAKIIDERIEREKSEQQAREEEKKEEVQE